jgi:hypothetical protein
MPRGIRRRPSGPAFRVHIFLRLGLREMPVCPYVPMALNAAEILSF